MTTDTSIITDLKAPDSPRDAKASAKGKSCNNGKRKSASLPSETVEYLKNWMMSPDHIAHPYPTEQEKTEIMKDTGIELKQLTNWFVNNRKRYWKPRVEARLQQQAQAATAAVQARAAAVVAVRVAQQHHAATLALNVAAAATTTTPSHLNPVSPETGFNNSSHAVQPCNAFVSFDLDTNRTIHPFQQQQQHQEVQQLHQTIPPSSPVTLTASALAQRQDQPTVAAAAVSETSSSSSVSASDEGDVSDFPPEDEETTKLHDRNVTFPSVETTPVTAPTTATRSRTFGDVAITKGARNVSFCSLEHVSGGDASAQEEDATIKTVETSVLGPASDPDHSVMAPSKHPKKRTYHIVEDSPRSAQAVSSSTAPRKRFRRMSLELWIDACKSASDNEDEGLPSLEEATRLFGYCK